MPLQTEMGKGEEVIFQVVAEQLGITAQERCRGLENSFTVEKGENPVKAADGKIVRFGEAFQIQMLGDNFQAKQIILVRRGLPHSPAGGILPREMNHTATSLHPERISKPITASTSATVHQFVSAAFTESDGSSYFAAFAEAST
jgi:hypothetical protein